MTEADIAPRLRERYGAPGPAKWLVTLFVDGADDVGGYCATMAIMDSPVSYYDVDGALLGVFHIFGDAEENTRTQETVRALRERYPHERPFTV